MPTLTALHFGERFFFMPEMLEPILPELLCFQRIFHQFTQNLQKNRIDERTILC